MNTCTATASNRSRSYRGRGSPDGSRLTPSIIPRPVGTRLLSGKRVLAYGVAVGDVYKALADPTRRALLDEPARARRPDPVRACAAG
ncbi:hypothetical protein GCM10025868_17590 [Angustibacter aerolatus]|uniref:Uncharacterized protein n=1 Tax=Angustibacter aerolatus TaxID=1162965 RepID=A0ABQ6JHA8_9ACTN|nr:hypothetical protein GCM10025868_17590 [Angustibacter aerolatus]